MSAPSIEQVLTAFGIDPTVPPGSLLAVALRGREDTVAFRLREMAGQFGLLPWVVDQVLANEVELGTPLPPEARQTIRNTFVTEMQRLNQGEEPS